LEGMFIRELLSLFCWIFRSPCFHDGTFCQFLVLTATVAFV
jgi:hypothetical protein